MTETKRQKIRDRLATEVMDLTKKQHSVTKKFYWIDFKDDRTWDYDGWKPDEKSGQANTVFRTFTDKSFEWGIIQMSSNGEETKIKVEVSGHKTWSKNPILFPLTICRAIIKALEANNG